MDQLCSYGHSEPVEGQRALWQGRKEEVMMAYDVISGYATKNTNNLRLWESRSKRGFDLQSFNGECGVAFLGGDCADWGSG